MIKSLESARDFGSGAELAFRRYALEAGNSARLAADEISSGMARAEDGLVAFATGSKKAGEAFKDFAKGVGEDLARMQIKANVTGPIAKALGGDGKSGGLVSSIGSWIGSMFGFESGGVMTGRGPVPLSRYATGGIASSPKLALYGEGKMPEAYVPLPDGRSIPVTLAPASVSQLGGPSTSLGPIVNITNHYDFSNANQGTVEQLRGEAERIKREAVQMAVATVKALWQAAGRRSRRWMPTCTTACSRR